MNLATIISILGAVSTLLGIVKEVPAVLEEAKSLLAKVEPHIAQSGGQTIASWFASLKEQAARS